jgi:hypothetical protein
VGLDEGDPSAGHKHHGTKPSARDLGIRWAAQRDDEVEGDREPEGERTKAGVCDRIGVDDG